MAMNIVAQGSKFVQEAMLTILILGTLLSLHCNTARGQLLRWRRCPRDIRAIRNFQSRDFLGTWYEVRRFATVYQTGRTCVKMTFSSSNSTAISVMERSVFARLVPLLLTGSGVYTDGPSIGSLSIVYRGDPDSTTANFHVIDINYGQYALVWNCRQFMGVSFQWLWLLTRERFPDLKMIDGLLDRWSTTGLPVRDMLITDQLFCDLQH